MKLALSNIETTTNIDSLQRCDLIIEAATEDTEIKKNIFRSVNEISTKKTILASNTSSISIDLMASIIDHPENFIGMHFMNPVPMMRLVEIIKGGKTSKNTEYKIIKLAEKMGKIPVVCNDSPGFVANRILIPMINEAIFTYEEGVATVESIDKIMTLGMNHPMGPLKLADLIGLDVVLNICKILHKDFNDDKYRPSNLLVRMVNDGKLGFKTGNGFYKY
jgi:3-hydroxybutyryl-CoA dehydrogenase